MSLRCAYRLKVLPPTNAFSPGPNTYLIMEFDNCGDCVIESEYELNLRQHQQLRIPFAEIEAIYFAAKKHREACE